MGHGEDLMSDQSHIDHDLIEGRILGVSRTSSVGEPVLWGLEIRTSKGKRVSIRVQSSGGGPIKVTRTDL
jgi:hypothetical protein